MGWGWASSSSFKRVIIYQSSYHYTKVPELSSYYHTQVPVLSFGKQRKERLQIACFVRRGTDFCGWVFELWLPHSSFWVVLRDLVIVWQ